MEDEEMMPPEDQAPQGGVPADMTAEEALDKALSLLLSEEMQPVVMQALTSAKDVAAAAAVLVAPIIIRMMQETDLPDAELIGDEQGDGIAVYLLTEVFDIATEAGLLPEPQEGDPEAQAMVQRAAELIGDMIGQSMQQMSGAGATPPEGMPMEEQPPSLMRQGA